MSDIDPRPTRRFDFFKTHMPASRRADYYLGCLNSSIFMDFKKRNRKICLWRISFDGFGCCSICERAVCLDVHASKEFMDEMKKGVLDQEKITKLVLELIRLNKDNIWKGALEKYKLIEKKDKQ